MNKILVTISIFIYSTLSFGDSAGCTGAEVFDSAPGDCQYTVWVWEENHDEDGKKKRYACSDEKPSNAPQATALGQ